MIAASATVDMSPADGLTKGGLRKATRIGINRAASPAKATVVANAAAVKRFGVMAKAVRIRVRMYPADRAVVVIGPGSKVVRTKGKFKRGKRKGQPRKIIPAKYAHLANKGTARSKANHWLDRASAQAGPQFVASVGREVGKEIELELERRKAAAR